MPLFRRQRRVVSALVAGLTILASALPVHAQDSGQPATPDGPAPPDIQQLIDQATQNGQVPPGVPTNLGSPLPTEATISQLRETLQKAMVVERQRELLGDASLGDNSDPQIAALQVQLLQAEYNENVLPMLQNATSNCLVAELGLEQALKWAKEVETLGLGNSPEDTADVGVEPRDVAPGEYGPLYDELVNVKALYVQALKDCDKEVYQQCVLDDTDPNVPFLGIVQAQLQYLDDDPVYYERYINCSIGWHGTFTAHEEISGSSRSRKDYPNGSSSTLTWDASGTRDLKIERANHAQGATGSAQGHSTTTQKIVTADKQCTSTTTSMVEQTATGSGDAVLRKIGTATNGDFVLSFIGPNEPDSNQHSTTTSQSSCARGASNPQKSDAIGRTAPFSGSIGDKLSDPYVERTSGRKIMRFQMGNLIQQTTGGTLVRDTGSGGSDYNPWLTAFFSDTEPNNQPVVNVTITWNLAFGQQ